MNLISPEPKKRRELDYEVLLPAAFRVPGRNPFKVGDGHFEDFELHHRIPLYEYPEYSFEKRESYSLKELMDRFAAFAKLVVKGTNVMREAKFKPVVCEEWLDYYYYDNPLDWDGYPGKDDNYYYVSTTPQL